MDRKLKFIETQIDTRLQLDIDDAFYIFDVDDVRMKYRKWVEKMPQVVPFYAVKCNDDNRIVEALAELGTGFDCASKKEIEQILSLGVHPDRIIYANTVKQVSHLKFAAEKKVMKVTFDSQQELEKIKRFHPKAQVVLRIRYDSENSQICLGLKFGCDPVAEAPNLIKLCKEMDLNLIGVSFHVGSGTQDYKIFDRALAAVHELFPVATKFGFKMNFVDIGGGFLGTDVGLLDNYAKPINAALEKHFSDDSISIISEPGRYFVESAFTLAVQIILKRITPDGHIHYYVNEGIYLSFLISYLYEEQLSFDVIKKSQERGDSRESASTIWGSTCNSKDKIVDNRILPGMEIGDWLVFSNMGAYTTSVSTCFNGFKIGDIIPFNE